MIPLRDYVWEGMANSWAARGAWDSTLVAFDHWVAADHRGTVEPGILPLIYQMAVAGAWLGGLDTARAADRRAAAVKYLRGLPPDSAAAKKPEARVAWADGMLAVLRRDLRGLAEARSRLQQSGGQGSPVHGALPRRLRTGTHGSEAGGRRVARGPRPSATLPSDGDTIRTPGPSLIWQASRLLLEQGDTSRALKLLFWHEAHVPKSAEPFRSQLFAGLAYYELARIEEAQGKNDLARDHYEQFLRRYDMPPPAHQHLVDEAKAALRGLTARTTRPRPKVRRYYDGAGLGPSRHHAGIALFA